MRRTGSGFTLVELLVVLTIVGILIALLMPAFSLGWQVAASSRCQRNLNVMYQAQGNWRADNGGAVLSGKAWVGRLLPYVERHESVFRCPMAPEPATTIPAGTVIEDDSGSGGGAGGGGGEAVDPNPQPPGSEKMESAFEFKIYWQQPSGSKTRGEFGWAIPLDSHPWVRRTPQGDTILYEVDDEGYTGAATNPPTFDDIKFTIRYENGVARNLQILAQKCQASPITKYIYDLTVNGEVFVADWLRHIGESYDFQVQEPSGGGDSGSGSGAGGSASGDSGGAAVFLLVLSDYGLSKGAYGGIGLVTHNVDPKLFFILDYPVPLANYTGDQDDQAGKWDKYFIEDTEKWQRDWGGTGETWQQYQSLRHFEQANVLFCDGHVEALGRAELLPSDYRWRYFGR